MKRQNAVPGMVALILLLPLLAWAGAQVKMGIAAEKEVVVVKDGKEAVKRVAATSIEPGNVIIYTMTYKNEGDETATDVALDDPIPQGTTYLPDSAEGKGTEILFSIDKGKSFKKPSLLTYEISKPDGMKEKHSASPDDYTHVRWVVKSIPPGKSGKVSFKVKVN